MHSVTGLISVCLICHQSYDKYPLICPDCVDLLQRTSRLHDPNLQVFSHDWHKMRVLGAYTNLLADLISQGKFNGQPELIKHLAALLAKQIKLTMDTSDGVVIPTPMACHRKIRRGYNQADIIACEISRSMTLDVTAKTIRHTGDNRVQHNLSRKERLSSRHKSFQITASVPECVYVVDDVMTTGATASAICRHLKAAGARYIEVWVLALTPN